MDDILLLTQRDWTYHVHRLELTLNKLKEKLIKCNIEKSFFVRTKWNTEGSGSQAMAENP